MYNNEQIKSFTINNIDRNKIVVDESDKIVNLDVLALRYIKNEYRCKLGYPNDRINDKDVVIVFDNEVEKSKGLYNENIFSKIGIEDQLMNCNNFIAIGSYGNDEIQPILKRDSKGLDIDTVFCGKAISISYDEEKDLIYVKFDENLFKLHLFQNRQIMIFNDNGIKFYLDKVISDLYNINNIFSNEEFSALDLTKTQNLGSVYLHEILQSSLIDPIGYLNRINDNSILLYYMNEALIISCKEIFSAEHKLREYSFSTGEYCKRVSEYESSKILEIDKYTRDKTTKNYIDRYTKIIGRSSKIKNIKYLLSKGSKTNATIMITGESGTGKSLIAKEIHMNSKRKDQNFIHVNCASIPYNLIESEIFGYEEGSFTGAKRGGKKGYFDLAHDGTIFLDEIGEFPLELQGKLLEVLQSKTFYRVGGSKKIDVDIRVITATNRDLLELVKLKKFRMDLFYRLNVFPIEMPSLKERIEDTPLLCSYLLPRICDRLDIEPLSISKDALERLMKYNWPGNIRELENVLEQSAILCDGHMILCEDIRLKSLNVYVGNNEKISLSKLKKDFERSLIIKALEKCNSNKSETAKYLGIGRTSLFEKIKKYNIE